MAVEAGSFAQGNRFGNCLHSDSEERVHYKFHHGARTAGSEIKVLPRNRAEQRLGGMEELLVAAAKKRQRALFGGWSAAGDRCIQKRHTGFKAQSVEFARGSWEHRAHLNDCRTGTGMRENTLQAGIDAQDGIVIRKTG